MRCCSAKNGNADNDDDSGWWQPKAMSATPFACTSIEHSEDFLPIPNRTPIELERHPLYCPPHIVEPPAPHRCIVRNVSDGVIWFCYGFVGVCISAYYRNKWMVNDSNKFAIFPFRQEMRWTCALPCPIQSTYYSALKRQRARTTEDMYGRHSDWMPFFSSRRIRICWLARFDPLLVRKNVDE